MLTLAAIEIPWSSSVAAQQCRNVKCLHPMPSAVVPFSDNYTVTGLPSAKGPAGGTSAICKGHIQLQL